MDHPDHFRKIVQKYVLEIRLRFTVDNKTAAWQKLTEINRNGLYHLTDTIHYEYAYHHEVNRK